MDLNKFIYKVVGSRCFLLSKSLNIYLHSIFLKEARMKPPKETKYVLFECNSFIEQPRQIKGCLVMIYKQVKIKKSELIKKYSMFKWRLFIIKKLTSTLMIALYVQK